MSHWYRQLRMLRRLRHETMRTDPQLAEMLTQFSQLAAGQPMPAHERRRTPLRVAARWVRAAGMACAIADGWLAAKLPDAAPAWAATGVWAGVQPARPRRPGRWPGQPLS
jgi:hypothetical protein